MFDELEKINTCPGPFEFYTAYDLWTDEHTSKQMLSFHLNKDIDASSRKTAFIDRSVDWIASYFNVSGKKIADFGCGPGLYAAGLARKNAHVTGIDFSRRSIDYAREVANRDGLDINFIHQNYLEFETDERFHLILMIMCDFCALSPAQRKKMLEKFYVILAPGGSVLLDVYSLKAFEEQKETAIYEINLLNGFWSSNKYYGFLNRFKYDTEKLVLDKYTIIEANRTRTIYNWFQHFISESLEQEFAACGFTIDKFYSDVAGSPFSMKSNEFAVVAKKNF